MLFYHLPTDHFEILIGYMNVISNFLQLCSLGRVKLYAEEFVVLGAASKIIHSAEFRRLHYSSTRWFFPRKVIATNNDFEPQHDYCFTLYIAYFLLFYKVFSPISTP